MTVIVPGRANCPTSTSWSVGRNLAGGDDVLHLGHHHRDDGPGLGDAGHLADHADLHHLRLDLAEAGGEAGDLALRDEDAGRPQHRVDDVARPQRELLDDAVGAGDDQGLVEIDLGLMQRGLRARLLRRQLELDLGDDRLAAGERGVHQALLGLDPDPRPVDLAPRDRVGVAPEQLVPRVELVERLLIGAAGLRDPALGLLELRLRHDHRGLDLGDLAPGRLGRRLLLRAVEPEQRLARRHPAG